MNYLKQFVIGSSFLVFAPLYYSVKHQSKKTYSYYNYSLVAPVWFGLWNILSLIIAEHYKLTMKQRFLVISILSSFGIIFIATYFKSYSFTKEEWYQYYSYIFIKYILIWNIVIYNIEKNF